MKKDNGGILEKLKAEKARIDGQRAELAKEIAKLEAEKAAIEQGKNTNGEAFSLKAIFNSTTTEEIDRKIASIKAALDLPYYADSEYRKLSIVYLQAVADTASENLESNLKEIEAAVKTIEETKERLELLRKNHDDIASAAAELMDNVGLNCVSFYCMDRRPDYIVNKYKELCSKYE